MRITTEKKGRDHVRRVMIGEEWVSRVTIIEYQMRIGSSLVKMGGIAGLETRKEHRMKGYARALMSDSVKYMQDEGFDISMLFGIPDFYPKFGYSTALASHRVSICTRDAEKAPRRYETREFQEGDCDAVLRIYHDNNATRTCAVLRTRKDWRGFKKGTRYGEPAKAFVVEDRSGEVIGYAAFDYSKDKVNIVEIGAERDDVFGTLLNEFARMAIALRVESINVFAPPDHSFTEYCHRYGCESWSRYPKASDGMMRIINLRSLFEKIREELQQRVSNSKFKNYTGSFEIRTNIGKVTLAIKDGHLEIMEEQRAESLLDLPQAKLTQLIVGYRSIRDILNSSAVKASGNIESLIKIFFPKSNPWIWLPDHF